MENQVQAPAADQPTGVQAAQPTTGSSLPEAQPGNLPGTTPQAEPQAQENDQVKELQRLLNERQVQLYQTQQKTQLLEQQLTQQRPSVQSQQNPYDPQTDPANWWKFELDSRDEKIAAKTEERIMRTFTGLAQQQAELQWAQAHPGVDINVVKGFAQMRGVQNLDDAYLLMNLPQFTQQVAQNSAQNAIQSFRQPQPGATPVRGGSSAPVEPTYKYEDLLRQYNQNPAVEESWPAKLKEDFWRETQARRRLYGATP